MARLVALATLGLHLATSGRYGWFRDELYFMACGRRLAWGYVDQPPLIALVSRIMEGSSLLLYRMPAALAHCGTILLTAAMARRLGGGKFAELLAAVCVAVAPIFLAFGYLLTMNAFEPLFYMAVALLVLRIVQGDDERLWLAVGALTGLALLNKHSFIFFAGCLLAGLALSQERRVLRSRWLLAGIAVAAVVVLPHGIWQVRAGFPMLELLGAQKWKNAPWTPGEFFGGQVLQANPLALPVWVAGAVFLFRRHRSFALAFLLSVALFAVLKGKAYYAAPAYPPLFAAGAAALERFRRARWAAIPVAVCGLAVSPLVIPVLSPERLAGLGIAPQRLENKKYGPLPQHFADQFGWPELVDAVRRAADTLSPGERAHARVYAQNYGEAAALAFLAPDLPRVISGHNSYFLWGPGPGEVQAVIIVGGGKEEDHRRSFTDVRLAAREADAPWAMPYERELPVFVCRGLRAPIEQIWPQVKHYE